MEGKGEVEPAPLDTYVVGRTTVEGMGIDGALRFETCMIVRGIGFVIIGVFESVGCLYVTPTEDIHGIVTSTYGERSSVCILSAGHNTYSTAIEHSSLVGDDVHYGGESHVSVE